jgi:ATP-dependent Clp protease ATP-binding subunit ClpC
VFAHLSQEEIRQIVDLMLKDLLKRLDEHHIHIDMTDEVKDFLAKEGYSEAYGARPLRRVIQKKIEDVLAEEILSGKYSSNDVLLMTMNDGQISIEKKETHEVHG